MEIPSIQLSLEHIEELEFYLSCGKIDKYGKRDYSV